MKIQGSDIVIQRDPLSYATGYVILNGSPHQTYDPQAMEYDPGRAIVPLIVLPWVSADDPKNEHSGRCTLHSVTAIVRKMVNGAWTNVVIDNTQTDKYFISDGTTIQGVTAPAGAVVFLVDVPPTEAVSIVITANVTDPVDGLVKPFVNTVELTTKTATTVQYKLRATEGFPTSLDIDPREFDKTDGKTDGKRLLTIGVQLYKEGAEVADANCKYFWYTWDGLQYTPITDDNQFWLRTQFLDNSTHELPGTIQVDIDYFDHLRLMASACPVGDETPTEPDFLHGSERVYFDYRRCCGRDVEGHVFCNNSIKLTDNEEVERYVQLRAKSGDLTQAEMDEHFRFDWILHNGNHDTFCGRGRSVKGRARTDFQATRTNVTSLKPKVYFMKCFKPVKDGNKYLVDGNGKVVCGQNCEQI